MNPRSGLSPIEYLKETRYGILARERESANARMIVDQLLTNIDQGSTLGFNSSGYGDLDDDDEIEFRRSTRRAAKRSAAKPVPEVKETAPPVRGHK